MVRARTAPPRQGRWAGFWQLYGRRHILCIGALGFASGVPLLLITSTLAAWFANGGMTIGALGLLAFVQLPYALKFIWGAGVRHGGAAFGAGAEAGLLDYALNFGRATRPLLLLPVGLAYAGIYYATFRFAIARFNLMTPGREPLEDEPASPDTAPSSRGEAFLAALGGHANLVSVSACTTRLRLVVAGQDAVNEARLKALGARGVLRPSASALQVVLGPVADTVAVEILAAMAGGSAVVMPAQDIAPPPPREPLAPDLVALLGGQGNVVDHPRFHGRLCVHLRDPALIDIGGFPAPPVRHVQLQGQTLHLLLAP